MIGCSRRPGRGRLSSPSSPSQARGGFRVSSDQLHALGDRLWLLLITREQRQAVAPVQPKWGNSWRRASDVLGG